MKETWRIVRTACACGGNYAWMKTENGGVWRMMGCVCCHAMSTCLECGRLLWKRGQSMLFCSEWCQDDWHGERVLAWEKDRDLPPVESDDDSRLWIFVPGQGMTQVDASHGYDNSPAWPEAWVELGYVDEDAGMRGVHPTLTIFDEIRRPAEGYGERVAAILDSWLRGERIFTPMSLGFSPTEARDWSRLRDEAMDTRRQFNQAIESSAALPVNVDAIRRLLSGSGE